MVSRPAVRTGPKLKRRLIVRIAEWCLGLFNAKCHCRKHKGLQPLATWQVGYTSDLSTAVVYRPGKQGESALSLGGMEEGVPLDYWPAYTYAAYLGAFPTYPRIR